MENLKKISGKDFVDKNSQILIKSDFHVTDVVVIRVDKYLRIELSNCYFERGIFINGKERSTNVDILLEKCKSSVIVFNHVNINENNSSITLYEVNTRKLAFENTIASISIARKCSITEFNSSFSSTNDFEATEYNPLSFEQSEIEHLHIEADSLPIDNIFIEDCNIGVFELEVKRLLTEININKSKVNEIEIIKSSIIGELRLGGLTEIETLRFQDSEIHFDLSFNGVIEEIIFLRIKLFGRFDFYHPVLYKKFFLDRVTTEQDIEIQVSSETEYIDISNCTFNQKLEVQNHESTKVNNDYLSFYLDSILEGEVYIKNVECLSIDFKGYSRGRVTLEEFTSKLIVFNEYVNEGFLRIRELKKHKSGFNAMITLNSILGKLEYSNIDLNTFDEVIFQKSDVSNIKFTNSRYPKNVKIESERQDLGYHLNELSSKEKALHLSEMYRQLKVAMESQSNRSAALYYKSKEYFFLKKSLKFGWDKLLLYINYFSNNHGLSWSRSVLFTSLLIIVTSLLYNFSLRNSVSFQYTNFWQLFKQIIQYSFEYISTFPKLNLAQSNNYTSYTTFIVIISRIFIGFGIYQTIAAFRKYGKN
ncbi:MAG: hypothetical protein RIC95_08565 [Vicingaceae bacterium]